MALDVFLAAAVAEGASDLHLTVGLPPMVRINGLLEPLSGPGHGEKGLLTAAELENLLLPLLGEKERERLAIKGEVDLSHGLAGIGRFRVNIFRQRGSLGAAIRMIPARVPELGELGLPPVLATLADKPRGLILVTGPTGSGKSTTLAALVRLINEKYAYHIITLEDPIEYLHQHGRSIVNQREVGSDTASFAEGLRAALRQDPDVILVGEMRDLETISTAITAAETGHLVLATLHTNDSVQAVDRIIDVFPPHQQEQLRVQLAAVLEGVVAQQLVARADGRGRVAAVEVLLATPAVRNLIREGKTHQLPMVLQTGTKLGMQSMDMSLRELVRGGVITREVAESRASNREELRRMLQAM